MESFLKRSLEKYFGDRLDFRVRLFNILAMTGMALSIIAGISSILKNESILSTIMILATTVIAYLLMRYASKSGRYQLCYTIAIIAIFIIAMSVLFFAGGGYENALPTYFIFAVIFTVFMLDGIKALVVSSVELLLYVSLCIIAYHYPDSVRPLKTRFDVLLDAIIGFTVVSASIGIALFFHFRLYRRQQHELEKAREEALEAKEILARQNDTLEQLNRMNTEFLGNISHELKTPLTVVSGYAQLSEHLLETAGETKSADIINKMRFISSEAERLALMVGQILDVTRIEEKRMLISTSPCHIDEIIHSTIKTYFPVLNKNKNKLEIHIEDDLPMIQADPLRISHVIINLIANSIRFTSAGIITVSAKDLSGFVEISVCDSGSGIPSAILPHIFERYNVPGGGSGGGRDTGTGLGLYICKHIVEAHGGYIKVKSEAGKGTEVRFTVPVVQKAPAGQ